jgi:hypothetical protein
MEEVQGIYGQHRSSGLTFPHFIASTYDPMLASFHATMANIPYATGYSPLLWQSGTDVMIPKSIASLRVDKLRTILLLDPEFNQNNKLLGRSLMRQAKKQVLSDAGGTIW